MEKLSPGTISGHIIPRDDIGKYYPQGSYHEIQFFTLGLPLKVQSTNKLIGARLGPNLGVSRTIYVNVDSPNLGVPYFNF